MDLRGLTLTREQIARYAKEERTIRAIEGAQADVVEIGNALTTTPFLTLSSDPNLGAERSLVLTGDLTAVDGGPNSTYTLGLSDTAVFPGVYGAATKTVSFTVTASGRITGATEFTLNTTNITEGTNLFYTDARARLALSGGTGITYNNVTGAIALTVPVVVSSGGSGATTLTGYLKGNGTSAFTASATIPASDISSGAAITKTDDTNVTLTLGGAPTTAVLTATSFTLGWTGTLAVSRGGTGAGSMTANALPKGNGTGAYTASNVSDDGNTVSIASGKGFSVARTAVTAPAAADGNVFSGTYTPTLTNEANLTASGAAVCQYMRVGNVVTVSGNLTMQPTAVTTVTQLGMSLPIASNFAGSSECGGAANAVGVASESVAIYSDATNDRARFQFVAISTANATFTFSFTYLII